MVRFSSKVIFILSIYLSFVLSAAIATDDNAYRNCLKELNQRFSRIRSQSNPSTKRIFSRKDESNPNSRSNPSSKSNSPPIIRDNGTIRKKVKERFKEFSELKYSNIKDNENNQQQIPDLPEELLSLLSEAGKSEFDDPEIVGRLFEETLGIRLENIVVEKRPGGFNSSGGVYCVTGKISGEEEEKTYFIKYLCPSLLVSKKRCRTEVINLEYIQNLIHDGHLRTGGFNFIFPLVSYAYKIKVPKKNKMKSKIFTISEGAKGRSLTDIVQGGRKEEINNAFKTVGETLANFHFENTYQFVEGEFNKRVVNNLGVPAHCDLHGDNIFCYYDLMFGIDNEAIGYSRQNSSWIAPVIYDIGYLIRSSYDRFGKKALKAMKKNENRWEPFKKLIEGYINRIEQLNPSLTQGIIDYFISCLEHINEIEYQDVFRKILGKRIKWNKDLLDNPFAIDIANELKEALVTNYLGSMEPRTQQRSFIDLHPNLEKLEFHDELIAKLNEMVLVSDDEEDNRSLGGLKKRSNSENNLKSRKILPKRYGRNSEDEEIEERKIHEDGETHEEGEELHEEKRRTNTSFIPRKNAGRRKGILLSKESLIAKDEIPPSEK